MIRVSGETGLRRSSAEKVDDIHSSENPPCQRPPLLLVHPYLPRTRGRRVGIYGLPRLAGVPFRKGLYDLPTLRTRSGQSLPHAPALSPPPVPSAAGRPSDQEVPQLDASPGTPGRLASRCRLMKRETTDLDARVDKDQTLR